MNQLKVKPGAEAWLLILLLSLIWGSSFILIKKGLLVYTSTEVAGLRIASAGIALSFFGFKNLHHLKPGKWPYLLISGLLGSFLPAFLFATAQTQLSSALTGVMNATTPIFALLIGALFFRLQFTVRSFAGVIIGFIGAFVLALANNSGFGNLNYYVFLVMAATACYGTNLNLIKAKLADVPSLAITSVSLGLVMPLAIIILLTTDFIPKTLEWQNSWFAFTSITLLGIIGTGIALIFFNRLVKLTSPVFTSLVTYFIPIVAIFWGLFDGEMLSIYQGAGIVIILLGVYLANKRKRIKAPQQ